MGCAIAGIFVICEGWINSLANDGNRGRVIGVYGTVASLGLMTGPVILTLVGTRGATPFVVGVTCLLLFLVPITILRRHVPTFEGDHAGGAPGFLRMAPALVLAVLVFALFESTFSVLFPVYGSRAGLDETEVTTAIAVLFGGCLCWQLPIGLLAEHTNARVLLILCAPVYPATDIDPFRAPRIRQIKAQLAGNDPTLVKSCNAELANPGAPFGRGAVGPSAALRVLEMGAAIPANARLAADPTAPR